MLRKILLMWEAGDGWVDDGVCPRDEPRPAPSKTQGQNTGRLQAFSPRQAECGCHPSNDYSEMAIIFQINYKTTFSFQPSTDIFNAIKALDCMIRGQCEHDSPFCHQTHLIGRWRFLHQTRVQSGVCWWVWLLQSFGLENIVGDRWQPAEAELRQGLGPGHPRWQEEGREASRLERDMTKTFLEIKSRKMSIFQVEVSEWLSCNSMQKQLSFAITWLHCVLCCNVNFWLMGLFAKYFTWKIILTF